MKWIKFTLETTTEAVDILSYELDAIGVEGIEIEDNVPLSEADKKQMFVDILPDPTDNDGSAKVHFYMEPENCNPEDLIMQVHRIFEEVGTYCDIGKGTVSISETEDKDWINNWKQFFKPFRADDGIVIKPTWEDYTPENENDIVIEIDPGIAFGTGSHETTKLCIRALNQYVMPGMNLLDVGCGSGILSIAGIKLGASHATAIDIDEVAVKVAGENMDVNKISEEQITLYAGNLIDDEELQAETGFECYDIVVANILADVIIPLSAVTEAHMKKDALFITSGIINTKEEEVRQALLENGFEIIDTTYLKEWVCFIAKIGE